MLYEKDFEGGHWFSAGPIKLHFSRLYLTWDGLSLSLGMSLTDEYLDAHVNLVFYHVRLIINYKEKNHAE